MPEKREQLEKFLEAAQHSECDESEARFDQAVKKVATAPPPKSDHKKTDEPGE